ncbi:hypothetical protein Q0590_05760 [Rhodocytophaga aerolata]|uniref:Chromosome partition protein Smc n=1 Tax=Rhodocytophaga aerolata TaxID=455078 RepID=A0ABT8R0X9_9BACT|nr:hypothetical protein [Rhodocytophaga aerolata]MDO1445745.1 hypothetical protein [Rhodocytophaga aerolata]
MNVSNTNKVIASIIAAVMLALLMTTFITVNKNSQLKEKANQERIQSEKLLSEKLLLTKQIEDFRKEISSLKGINKETDLLLEKANRNLNEKEATINKLSKDASDAKQVKAQLADVKKIRENLLAELKKINTDNTELKASNAELQGKNDELKKAYDNLLAENNTLAHQLREKSFTGTNFKIEVIKGKKDKLTVKAKKTDKIRIEFEVAANTYPIDPTFIHVDLLSPEKTISAGETDVKVENQAPLSASLDKNVSNETPQKIIIEYTPKEKMNLGSYTAIVFHKNTFLGKAQFRLMK